MRFLQSIAKSRGQARIDRHCRDLAIERQWMLNNVAPSVIALLDGNGKPADIFGGRYGTISLSSPESGVVHVKTYRLQCAITIAEIFRDKGRQVEQAQDTFPEQQWRVMIHRATEKR